MRETTPLSKAFLAHVRDLPAGAQPSPDLERLLASALETARAAWPDVRVEDAEVLEYVAARLPEDGAPDAATRLAEMHVSDLYLACACARGDDRALKAFDVHFLPEVASFVAQIDRSPSFAVEVRQQLREKLFFHVEGEAPKIADFTGRGPLGGWLRVAAVRTALNLRRSRKDHDDANDPAGPALVPPTPDPELDYLKTRYGRELREALVTTLANLPADERNVLRMHYIDGLNIDEVGTAYRVHRSTVARWLSASREKILKETKRALGEKLHLDRGEVESMIGLVQSQLDVSIYRLLDEPGRKSGGS
jgi:RNA polymerase sigma-70 factor, ECF subfamily